MMFEDLPKWKQDELIAEAYRHPMMIGGRVFYPDPAMMTHDGPSLRERIEHFLNAKKHQ